MAYDINDLTQLINLRSGHLTQKAKRQEDFDTSLAKGLEHFQEGIEGITNEDQFTHGQASINYLATLANSPETNLMVQESNLEVQNRGNHIVYYSSLMNDTINEQGVIEPSPATNLIETFFPEGGFAEKDFWKKQTLQDIMNYNLNVDTILSASYEDMFAEEGKEKENDYVQPGDKPKLVKIRAVKKQLEAALVALNENGTIDEHELQYILMGNAAGLEAKRQENQKIGNTRLTSIMRSVNSIQKYKKELANILMKAQAEGQQIPDVAIGSKYVKDNSSEITATSAMLLYLNNPESYIDERGAFEHAERILYEATPQKLIEMWESEERLYMQLFQAEHDKYFKWTGSEWAVGQSAGYLDRAYDEETNQMHINE